MDAARVAKNTIFLYGRIVVNIIISLYSTRLILSALGVDDFGIYNLVAGVIAMLGFLNGAMAEASLRFMAFAHGQNNIDRQKSIFNVSIVLHTAIAFFVIILLEIAGIFLFNGILDIPNDRLSVAKTVYQFMLVSTFFTITKVPFDAVLKAHENMLVFSFIGIVTSVLKLIIAIYVTYTTFDQLLIYGLLMAVLSVLMIIVLYIYCYLKYTEVKLRLRKYFDKSLLLDMGSFAGWSFLIQSTFIITMQGTTVLLNSFFGVIVNAAQGIANQVSNQLKNFSATLHTALNPVIVKREGKKDRDKMLYASMFGNKISFFILSLLSIPLLIEMPLILDLWLKEIPEFAIIFCRLQLVRLIIGALTQNFGVAIGAIGKIKKYAIWESIVFVLVLPSSYLLYKLGFSEETIYINLIIAGSSIAIVRVYFLNKLGGLSVGLFLKNVVLRGVVVFVLVFGISLFPLLLLELEGIVRLLLVLFTSTVSLMFFGYYFGFGSEERKQVQRLKNWILLKK